MWLLIDAVITDLLEMSISCISSRALMRDCDHFSTSAAFHAVIFLDSLIGLGKVPFLTFAQIDDPLRAVRFLTAGRRRKCVGCC